MKCPKCNGMRITATRNICSNIRGASDFNMECYDCGRKWREKCGYGRGSDLEGNRHRWHNVRMVENSFEKERRESLEKINQGICPRCGGDLLSEEVSDPCGKQVRYETVCESEACFMRIVGVMNRDRWDKEMQEGRDRHAVSGV